MNGTAAMTKDAGEVLKRVEAVTGVVGLGSAANAVAPIFWGLAELSRLEAAKQRAIPPVGVGPVPAAPARGAMRIETMREGQSGGTRRITGLRLAEADVFDDMIASARRKHIAKFGHAVGPFEGEKVDHPFRSPFTPGQVYMARHYRDLTEKHGAGGIKCSSIEAMSGGGTGGDFMEAYLRDGEELKRIHRLIGAGSALVVRRNRPSKRGSKVSILDRRLVDMVCLAGQTIGEVLTAHGWTDKGEHFNSLRTALAAVLDRMSGYRD